MAESILNDIFWNLSAALNATDTTMTVAAYQGVVNSLTTFPSSGSGASIRARIDNELLLLTSWSGNTFTVTRGIEGTTAATHATGAEIDAVVTRGGLDSRLADQSLSGPYSSLPAAGSSSGTPGRLYLPSDSYAVLRDSGGGEANSWHAFGPISPMVQPPGSGAWTGLNIPPSDGPTTTSVTVDYTSGFPGIYTSGNGDEQRITGLYMAAPTTNFSITAMFTCGSSIGGGAHQAGILVLDPATSKLITVGLSMPGPGTQGAYYPDPHTYGATLTGFTGDSAPFRYFRMAYDGTNVSAWCSNDGVFFHLLFNALATSFVVPTAAGFYLNNYSTGSSSIRLLSWQFS